MEPGLYEQLLTLKLAKDLEALQSQLQGRLERVEPSESPQVLALHLAQAVRVALESVEPGRRVEMVNTLLGHLSEQLGEEPFVDERLLQLLSVGPPNVRLLRPGIPLNSTDLLVNARGEHRIGSELVKELETADRVDLVCSFLKWSGLRLLLEPLTRFQQRGGRLRVLTTCYLGATEVKTLDHLCSLGEVQVSYDSRRTRLHAKAWLFHRKSGFSTAYVGSSNMSSAALQDGLEWNVRLSPSENPRVLKKFEATFESYWRDPEFEPYRPDRDRDRFVRAVREQGPSYDGLTYSLEVRAYPFQQEILDRLSAERELHNRHRNLVVAATGTGKTVIAGLDYCRYHRAEKRARLLFIAHRAEILKQSLTTFRAILKDGTFGDLWTGSDHPQQDDHLFASVQKLSNVDLQRFEPDHFDLVIIDEFHHAAAPTYDRLLQHFKPKILLGLTATPERSDGASVLHWFEGRVATELRLWDALERGLLCPFHYFGIHDNTDLSAVPFQRGRYRSSGLENLYTGNDARVMLILKEMESRLADTGAMRALGFCATVEHAQFMASRFRESGYHAVAVTGQTPPEQRREAIASLRRGDRDDLRVIFTVDVFNEGVDLPEVDTLLLLRPTESATIFLQQLGRGLRLSEGKECLTVLDFIGFQAKDFRFDAAVRTLIGGSRKEMLQQLEQGFPHLPSGCSVQLDRVAQAIVVENIKKSLRGHRAFLKQELSALGPKVGLEEFLARTGLELTDLYRGRRPGWKPLRQEVGFEKPIEGHPNLLKAIARLTHLDSTEYLRFLQETLSRPSPPRALPSSQRQVRMLTMLHFSLWSAEEARNPILRQLDRLWEDPVALAELRELLPVLEERVDHLCYPLEAFPTVPLSIHCRYSLSEILAAFGELTPERPHRIREGVFYHKTSGWDLFFVTVQKNEKDYSPTTLYRDFALSPELFHWESQSTTSSDSKTGKRYQSHRGPGGRALFFVRESSKDDRNETRPYLFLGPAEYLSHQGDRPMSITWKLEVKLPISGYRQFQLTA